MEQPPITDEMKSWCACTTMRDMLLREAQENHISYEEALLQFAASKTYEGLFDFDTAIWKEGPEYLRELYEEEIGDKG